MDSSAEADARDWLARVTGDPVSLPHDPRPLQLILRDGCLLCRALNAAFPRRLRVPHASASSMPFRHMENIAAFNAALLTLPGFRSFDTFATVDLYEGKNMAQVVRCILACKRLHERMAAEVGAGVDVDAGVGVGTGPSTNATANTPTNTPTNTTTNTSTNTSTNTPTSTPFSADMPVHVPAHTTTQIPLECDDLIEPRVELVESPVQDKCPFLEDDDLGTFTIEVS